MDRQGLERHIRDTPVKGSPAGMRAAFLRLARPDGGPLPEPERVADVPGRWFGQGGRPIVWLHGGGYVFGGSDTHAAPALHLARAAGRRVFVPDYPLAPEVDFAAIRDAVMAVVDALPECDVVGDSAGGHLALVLVQRGARPGRMALLSPNTDRSGQSATRQRNSGSDLMNDDAQDAKLGAMAMGDRTPDDPEVSPLLGDLGGLPPTYLSVAADEVLLDDGLLLAREAGLAGADLTLRVWPGLFHMWHLWPDATPEGSEILGAVAAHLNG